MSMEASRTSILEGSLLQAAHKAARKAYPLPEVSQDADGEVMARRAHMVEYGPHTLYQVEANVAGWYAESGIRAIEQMLAETIGGGTSEVELMLAVDSAYREYAALSVVEEAERILAANALYNQLNPGDQGEQ